MSELDCYEFWIDVLITGNAIDTDNVSFGDTDGEGDYELGKYLKRNYPGYEFSHCLDGKNVYTCGNDVMFVLITVGSISHDELFGE